MKQINILLLIILFVGGVSGQPNPNRYKSEVFNNVSKTSQVQFSTAVSVPNYNFFIYLLTGFRVVDSESSLTSTNLFMDIYEPVGDVVTKRPLVVLCFGGGFVDGAKDYWSMVLLAEGLAKMGYVVASIDYRLGMMITDEVLAARAVYRGVQDSYSAIRYFRADAANADVYKIDPEQIFIGGHSSGGFMALHNLYMDNSERPPGTFIAPDQGELNDVGDNLGYDGRATGGFNLAGAVVSPDIIEASDPGMALFHSSDDGTVNIGLGVPFPDYDLDLPAVYGSDTIAQRFVDLGINHTYNKYFNRGHGVHELSESNNTLYADIFPAIGDWLYESHLKPDSLGFEGIQYLCASENTTTYTIDMNANAYWNWQIQGGSILDGNQTSSVQVEWDVQAGTHSLSCTPYSKNYAAGATTSQIVSIQPSYVNNWIDGSSSWTDPSSWSLGRVPLSCDDIEIGNQVNPTNLLIDNGQNNSIKSMELGSNVNLTVASGSILEITSQ